MSWFTLLVLSCPRLRSLNNESCSLLALIPKHILSLSLWLYHISEICIILNNQDTDLSFSLSLPLSYCPFYRTHFLSLSLFSWRVQPTCNQTLTNKKFNLHFFFFKMWRFIITFGVMFQDLLYVPLKQYPQLLYQKTFDQLTQCFAMTDVLLLALENGDLWFVSPSSTISMPFWLFRKMSNKEKRRPSFVT